MQRMPVGFVEEVILTRRYVEAYHAIKADPKSADDSPMRTLAQEIEMQLAEEEYDKANG